MEAIAYANPLVESLENEASSRVEQHLSSYLDAAKQLDFMQ